MILVEYFLKKMAEREAALVVSPASGQEGDRPTPRDRIRFDSAQPRTEGIRPDKYANPIRRINDSISLTNSFCADESFTVKAMKSLADLLSASAARNPQQQSLEPYKEIS
jgi:hypothetical protein